ncbi:hypothetical protein [Dapis sp. BLCC M172]|uniref:hypothetical protein n=1 Tax=Dapis sp. BLCC M172 TaxID=2975281 RepID=UPI003CF227A8
MFLHGDSETLNLYFSVKTRNNLAVSQTNIPLNSANIGRSFIINPTVLLSKIILLAEKIFEMKTIDNWLDNQTDN